MHAYYQMVNNAPNNWVKTLFPRAPTRSIKEERWSWVVSESQCFAATAATRPFRGAKEMAKGRIFGKFWYSN
jgi:hypothetical protein